MPFKILVIEARDYGRGIEARNQERIGASGRRPVCDQNVCRHVLSAGDARPGWEPPLQWAVIAENPRVEDWERFTLLRFD